MTGTNAVKPFFVLINRNIAIIQLTKICHDYRRTNEGSGKAEYGEIALQDKETNAASCLAARVVAPQKVYNIMSDDYTHLQGYNADADLGLGCGLPTQYAKYQKKGIQSRPGSGAGNDCFIARAEYIVTTMARMQGNYTGHFEERLRPPCDLRRQKVRSGL